MSVRLRLSVMMFLQFFIWGAWYTTIAVYMTNHGMGTLTHWPFTVNPVAAIVAPFFVGLVADRFFATERVLGALHLVGGLLLLAVPQFTNQQTNGVGKQGATQPANGYQQGDIPGPQGFADAEYLHGPTYAAAIDNNGNADCEVGQRGYVAKLNSFDPAGRSLDAEAHTPGDQGPTFHGRPRVPAGETFSRAPQTGPQPLFNPTNP